MTTTTRSATMTFAGVTIEELDAAPREVLDEVAFGIVAMDAEHSVTDYNRVEAELSGLSPETVLGRQFFTDVAPCTNNFMVAHRFEDEPSLDDVIDYVFTYRMRPTQVRLRMLKSSTAARRYLLVEPIA